jgi:hypothetical protein
MTKKSKTKSKYKLSKPSISYTQLPIAHRNRMIETSKDSHSSKPSKTTSTHHVPMGSAIKSFFSDKPKPTTTVTSSKASDSHYSIKYAEKTTNTSKVKHTATTTHDKFPVLHSLFPTGLTEKPSKTHHQDLGGVIESKISSFFHPPKKTDDEESSKTHHLHIPRPSFLDPLFSHHDHDKTSTSDKETTSTQTKTHTKYDTDSLSSTDSTMTAKPTTPMTPTTTSTTLETSKSTISSTTLPTTTSEISQTISYTTRSFSITSSTATPSLVLGVFDCARDPHTINGKCDSEYFCNSAIHQCVALANIGGSCYEDFQCGSTYCENNKCVLYPGYQPGAASMSGGQIAGATVGSVAGATVVLFGLLGWRRRAQSVNRRIEQLKKSNDDVGFYTDYGIAPVDPTRNTTRESKYDFLNQMLKTQPTTLDKPGSPTDMSSIQDPWKAEDQEMNHKRRYTFF